MPDDAGPVVRLVATTIHGRSLVRPPVAGPAAGWLVGFHGQAQSAAEFLALLERIPAARSWLVVAVQALHVHYTRRGEVVASWMTRQDREHAIADNIAYVDAVVAELAHEFGPPGTLVFAGFSQGVAMAFRAALRGRHECAAVIVAGGDVPPEILDAEAGAWPRIVMFTGRHDDWYTPRRLDEDAAALRSRGARVTAEVFEGAHAWSDEVVAVADRLLSDLRP